jgi:hypothetical protein
MTVGWLERSREGDYIYFDGALPAGQQHGIFRARISDHKIEQVIHLDENGLCELWTWDRAPAEGASGSRERRRTPARADDLPMAASGRRSWHRCARFADTSGGELLGARNSTLYCLNVVVEKR